MNNWKQFVWRWFNLKPEIYLYPGFIAFFLFFAPHPISKGCGPFDPSFRGYSFLSPDLVDLSKGAAPFFLDFATLYEYYDGPKAVQEKDNVTEWWERFCEYPEKEDIAYIIYQTSSLQLGQLNANIYSERAPMDYQLATNTFARYLKTHKCTETLDYLIFAKKCEPHCQRLNPWEYEGRNLEAMYRLIEEGKKAFERGGVKSHYLRLRYAYQIVRLAHYAKDYELAVELYDYCRPKADNEPSIIDYWLLGHKAGALRALGNNVESAYLFSLIFENCPSKRESAYRSFRINNDEEWKQCLLLCKNDHERATLYAMRAAASESHAQEEMAHIYELDPQNPHLETLLVREMKKLEKNLLGLGWNDFKAHNKRYHDIPKPWAGNYVIDLQAFVRRVLEDGQLSNLSLWKIAEGYLELLAGDYYQANRTLKEAGEMLKSKDKALKDQLEVFQLALEISSFDAVTDSVENNAARIISGNDWYQVYPDFPDFLFDKMSKLYEQTGHPGKAFLSRHRLEELKPNPQIDIIEDLIATCMKDKLNRMEKELVEIEAGETIINDLLDIKATQFLSRFQLEAALETYKEMDRAEWDNYGLFNPFVDRFHDCVHCALPDTVTVYNKGELIERLLDLEYRAKSEPDNSARFYYQMGMAFYNMSYFSYAWEAGDYYRSGASLSTYNLKDGGEVDVINSAYYPYGNREVFDCSQARYLFDRARLLAKDDELAARAAHMSAKCERNAFYVDRINDVPRTFQYFDILKDKYSETTTYKRLQRECKTFQAYLRR